MLERRNVRQKFRVLIVHGSVGTDDAGGRACKTLAEEFGNRDIDTVLLSSVDDARSTIIADTAIQAIMIDWLLPSGDSKTRKDGDNAAAKG